MAVQPQHKEKPAKICIDENEFEIYRQVGIDNFLNETEEYPDLDYLKKEVPEISTETIADFKEKNSKRYLLNCLNKNDGKTKKLKKIYRTTVSVGFSRIGFDKSFTQALVYSGFSAPGNYCGSEFVFLKRINERWQVEKRLQIVIC